jgi:cyanate permease
MDTQTRYPMHFYRGFVAMFVISALIFTALMVADHGFDLNPAGLLAAYVTAAIGAFCVQFLLSRLSFVEVARDGISGSTFWGRRGFVRWEQIRSTHLYYVFPMGLIHVRTLDKSPALWLPTHVKRQSNLAEDLRNFAPADNPLVERFAK